MDQTLIQSYTAHLKRRLSPHRFRHSLGVMSTMCDLAELYGLDRTRAAITGLVHDIAKELPKERLLALADDASIPFGHPCERLPIYLHGPVGAYLAKRELVIGDPIILEAIASHTFYGSAPFDNHFQRCLWLADLTEPTRTFPGVDKLRATLYEGRMEEALLLHSGWVIDWFQRNRIPIHPQIETLFETLSARLEPDQALLAR